MRAWESSAWQWVDGGEAGRGGGGESGRPLSCPVSTPAVPPRPAPLLFSSLLFPLPVVKRGGGTTRAAPFDSILQHHHKAHTRTPCCEALSISLSPKS